MESRVQGHMRRGKKVRISQQKRREKWGNRMATVGITFVVLSLAAAVGTKGMSLKVQDERYAKKEEQLLEALAQEEERAKQLEEKRVHVQTKQYASEVAKERLGLVYPDEILLKPNEKK